MSSDSQLNRAMEVIGSRAFVYYDAGKEFPYAVGQIEPGEAMRILGTGKSFEEALSAADKLLTAVH